MQLKQHVSLGFTTFSIADKLVFGGKVSTAIGTNATTLPALPFNKAAIDAVNTDLNTKTIAASGGDASAMDARNVSEKSWNKIFRDNGVYIDFVAKGDVTIINKSGYVPTKDQTQASVAPDMVSGLTTSVDGLTNAVKVSVNADTNVDAFAFIAGTSGVSGQWMVQRSWIKSILFPKRKPTLRQ